MYDIFSNLYSIQIILLSIIFWPQINIQEYGGGWSFDNMAPRFDVVPNHILEWSCQGSCCFGITENSNFSSTCYRFPSHYVAYVTLTAAKRALSPVTMVFFAVRWDQDFEGHLPLRPAVKLGLGGS